MTEAEQTAAAATTHALHAARCQGVLYVADMGRSGLQGFILTRCHRCGLTITATIPIAARPRDSDLYGLTVTWGFLGPPTPQNATNPTASAGA